MPEPITPAAATLASATAAVPTLVAFGVNLGLRPDVLVAGFAGALVAIVLLGSVPSDGDTWRHLARVGEVPMIPARTEVVPLLFRRR